MNDVSTALLTEHFSYTPLSLIDDIINSVNNLIYQAISSLEDGLHSTPPDRLGFRHSPGTIPDTDDEGNVLYPEARLEIENGLHQLETLLEATVDKAFDKFEIYVLRNILTVPADLAGWIRLSHHENISFDPDRENAPTPESITLQRKKLRETRKLNRALTQESERNDAIISQLRSMLSSTDSTIPTTTTTTESAEINETSTSSSRETQLHNLSFLLTDPRAKHLKVGDSGAGSSRTPLTTNTTFILSQLPALRAVLTQLRAKLKALPQSTGPIVVDPKREERREYIDSRIRLHLERTGEGGRGESGGHGLVVKGRKVDGDEVQALEGAVQAFPQ